MKKQVPTLKVSSIALCAGLTFVCTLFFQNCSPVGRAQTTVEQSASRSGQ